MSLAKDRELQGGSPTSLPPPVILVDPATGLTEEIGYFAGETHALYGVLHTTPGNSTTGVVVAPPFLMEFQRNYRREVLAAKALSAAGFPTLRFSYQGQGHSAGHPRDLGFDTAVADTIAAIARLQDRSGVDRVVIIGTRVATLVAAAAARLNPSARHVVGWDPLAAGSAWLRELGRAARVQAMRDEDTAQGSLADQLGELGETEVLGSSLYPALYEGIAGRSLVELASDLERLALVQFGKPDKPKKALVTAADELIASGVSVDMVGVDEEEIWWATRRADYFQAESDRALTKQLVPLTVGWVREVAS